MWNTAGFFLAETIWRITCPWAKALSLKHWHRWGWHERAEKALKIIIYFFCSPWNFSFLPCFLSLAFCGITARLFLGKKFHLVSWSKAKETEGVQGENEPTVDCLKIFWLGITQKQTLPKPLRNLLTLRCSFSWMESKYSCTLTSNSPEEKKKRESWLIGSPSKGWTSFLTAARYLSEPACGALSPGWTIQTSESPWRPPGSGGRSWTGSLYENPHAERSRAPGRRKRKSSRLPVLRWWRVDSGLPARRRNEQRPRTQRC